MLPSVGMALQLWMGGKKASSLEFIRVSSFTDMGFLKPEVSSPKVRGTFNDIVIGQIAIIATLYFVVPSHAIGVPIFSPLI